MRIARWALAAVAAFAFPQASAAPADASQPFMVSPRAHVELPPQPTPEDIAAAGRLLRSIEALARVLDRHLVEAGVLDKKKVPSPDADAKFDKAPDAVSKEKSPPPGSWRCVMTRTRDEMVAFGKPLQFTVNTQGTAFYCNGRDAVFGYVPFTDDDAFRRDVLSWGAQMVLHHRVGLYYSRVEDPPGVCILQGFKSFVRWSHLPPGGAMPAELGGIPDSLLTKLEKLAKDGRLIPLQTLFVAENPEFDDKSVQEVLYGQSAALVEMLWHREPPVRKLLLELFAKYATTARPVKEFSYDAFLEKFRKPIGDAPAIQRELRAWILEKSRALNAKKMEAAAAAK